MRDVNKLINYLLVNLVWQSYLNYEGCKHVIIHYLPVLGSGLI